MKIVIDIDNESYEHIKAYANDDVLPIGWYAIIHGTPLDKIKAEIESCRKDVRTLAMQKCLKMEFNPLIKPD